MQHALVARLNEVMADFRRCGIGSLLLPTLVLPLHSASFTLRTETSNIYTDSASSSPTANTFTRRQTYARLHALLSSLIYLIPTLPNILWPILNKFLPYKRENRNAHVVYFTNALKIVEYCPQLGENVLGAIMLRAIQIDVSGPSMRPRQFRCLCRQRAHALAPTILLHPLMPHRSRFRSTSKISKTTKAC